MDYRIYCTRGRRVSRGGVPRGRVSRGGVPRGRVSRGGVPRGRVSRGGVPRGRVSRQIQCLASPLNPPLMQLCSALNVVHYQEHVGKRRQVSTPARAQCVARTHSVCSNLTQCSRVIFNGQRLSDDSHVRSYNSHVRSYDSHVRSYDSHVRPYDSHVRSYASHVRSYASHVRSYASHVRSYASHVRSYASHVRSYTSHVRSYDIHVRSYDSHVRFYDSHVRSYACNGSMLAHVLDQSSQWRNYYHHAINRIHTWRSERWFNVANACHAKSAR